MSYEKKIEFGLVDKFSLSIIIPPNRAKKVQHVDNFFNRDKGAGGIYRLVEKLDFNHFSQ